MIRIAVVEDDDSFRKDITGYLSEYAKAHGKAFRVSLFHDGRAIANGYVKRYDIILMDIEMKNLNGMEAAEAIRKVDREVIIIFITHSPQYAIRGYAVEALDYILKPIAYYPFSKKLERAIDRIGHRQSSSIKVNLGKGKVRVIDLRDLYYIEVNEHTLVYHTKGGDVSVSGKLKDVENELAGKYFFRCNKCYLVNLEHVSSIENDNAVVGSDVLQISRSKKKPLMDALNNYVNEVGG